MQIDLFSSNILGSGLEDINGVFEESNTYQPSVPSSEAEIIVSWRIMPTNLFYDTSSLTDL